MVNLLFVFGLFMASNVMSSELAPVVQADCRRLHESGGKTSDAYAFNTDALYCEGIIDEPHAARAQVVSYAVRIEPIGDSSMLLLRTIHVPGAVNQRIRGMNLVGSTPFRFEAVTDGAKAIRYDLSRRAMKLHLDASRLGFVGEADVNGIPHLVPVLVSITSQKDINTRHLAVVLRLTDHVEELTYVLRHPESGEEIRRVEIPQSVLANPLVELAIVDMDRGTYRLDIELTYLSGKEENRKKNMILGRIVVP